MTNFIDFFGGKYHNIYKLTIIQENFVSFIIFLNKILHKCNITRVKTQLNKCFDGQLSTFGTSSIDSASCQSVRQSHISSV